MTGRLPPRPVPDLDTQYWWDAVAQRRLVIPRCAGCQKWIWQPKPLCPSCHRPEPVWTQVTGEGTVVSWTALHPPVLEVWKDKLPFVVLLVELSEGVRLVGQLVDDSGTLLQTNGDDLGLAFGDRVGLRWRADEAGQTLPVWTLVRP